jgi:hypothetical protein
MASDRPETTTPNAWAVELDDGFLLAPDSEERAVEDQQVAEYEQGFVAIVHRGYANA